MNKWSVMARKRVKNETEPEDPDEGEKKSKSKAKAKKDKSLVSATVSDYFKHFTNLMDTQSM